MASGFVINNSVIAAYLTIIYAHGAGFQALEVDPDREKDFYYIQTSRLTQFYIYGLFFFLQTSTHSLLKKRLKNTIRNLILT